ncbi:DNA-binding response regulator [Arthrobacter woluwensis]|uniref:response regulator n=1 Tax=Arthrobacter woluwensis TaxID=156980 RepID=UPI000D1284DC|nr:response regulator transcription factor [Arthrobacter woluwensis]PSS42971.1 DNA-binding response regulator [Arthrobacter woluwensis]
MIRVLLVDDHPVVRAGLKAMLEDPALPAGDPETAPEGFAGPAAPTTADDAQSIRVVAEASDGAAALEELRRRQTLGEDIDLVLMDLQMGDGMDGATATRKIRQGEGGVRPVPVLVLTTYDSDSDILSALEAGASGYMLKDAESERIRAAVRAAAAGETALAPEVAARLVGRLRNPVPQLSAREVEILELLATGLSNRALARALFISEATVKTHLVHIYAKLGVDNRTAAITTAVQQKIIRVPDA